MSRIRKGLVLQRFKRGARRLLGDRRMRRIKVRRQRLVERLGLSSWAAPGLLGLDLRLLEHVQHATSRTFIEFGANDGVQQSNTYLLERDHGWHGVLVEPIPELAAECQRNRPRALVVAGAVCEPAIAGSAISFVDNGLMSHRGAGRQYSVGLTLSSVIEDLLGGEVGLVVVDVEGAELEALAGLDLARHQPEFLLIETAQLDRVSALLEDRYLEPVGLSHHDYLFRRRAHSS